MCERNFPNLSSSRAAGAATVNHCTHPHRRCRGASATVPPPLNEISLGLANSHPPYFWKANKHDARFTSGSLGVNNRGPAPITTLGPDAGNARASDERSSRHLHRPPDLLSLGSPCSPCIVCSCITCCAWFLSLCHIKHC